MHYSVCEADGVILKNKSINHHQKSVHITVKSFQCDQCSKNFKNKHENKMKNSRTKFETRLKLSSKTTKLINNLQ